MFKISMLFLFVFTIVVLAAISIFPMIEEANSTLMLILFFASIYLIIIFFLYLIYYSINKRNSDIEMSKSVYYYSKPYIIKIDNYGKFLIKNDTFEKNIHNSNNYHTIYDLECEVDNFNVLEEIFRQHPFTIKFQSNVEEALYVRFLPLKLKQGFYLIGEDITEQLNDFNYHRNMALYNEVTKLPNKNYLGIKLQELFANENQLAKKNTLVAMDIVGFKNINKLFGYKIGDETLREFGKHVTMSIEKYQAELYNTELDNFMVLFRDCRRYQDVLDWAHSFTATFEKPIDVQGNLFTIDVKVGIFHIEVDKYASLNSVDAYEFAHLALKKAKESRRFSTIVYDITLGQHFTREQLMEVDLASAIRKNELTMHLQPQLNNNSNKIVGFEALIRWNNPKYALDSPIKFIEIAERNNLIVDIGRFVINETFKIAKELEPYDVRLSINISPVQILQTGFVHDVITAYDKYQLKPNSVCIEITETFLMESLDAIIEKLTLIRNQGINIHLDNFGTGYSSMLYLKDLPIDGISINKEFIRNLDHDQYSRNIVSRIISLAASLELQVIAEGVEDEKQNTYLKERGCNIVQGYYISKALPKSEAIEMMLEYNQNRSRNIF